MSEKPYSGLTAAIKINGTILGYMNNVELNIDKDIVEVIQFGSQWKEKQATIKDWKATAEGTVAFVAGGSQQKLYQAFVSGELITLITQLDASVFFEGTALVSSLSISGAPDDNMNISAEFEGSGGLTFTLPTTVFVTITSDVGGTTDPAGTIRLAKTSGSVVVTCTPSSGKVANKYYVNGSDTGNAIVANTFTLTSLTANTTVRVDWVDVE